MRLKYSIVTFSSPYKEALLKTPISRYSRYFASVIRRNKVQPIKAATFKLNMTIQFVVQI